MRILTYISASTPTPAARVALDFCLGARELGHEAILAGLIRTRETPGLTELGAAADAVRIPFRLLHQRYRYDPGIIGQMETMFRRFKPHVYLSHDYLGAAVARVARYRPACVEHFVHEDGFEKTPMENHWMGRRLLKLTDGIIAPSSLCADRIEKIGIKKENITFATDPSEWIASAILRATSLVISQ